MGFQLFERYVGRDSRRRPTLEVTSKGRIRFNKKAGEELLGDASFALLAYDPETSSIGIIPRKEEDPSAFPIKTITGGRKSIAAKPFFNRFNIQLPPQGVRDLKPELKGSGPTGEPMIVVSLAGR